MTEIEVMKIISEYQRLIKLVTNEMAIYTMPPQQALFLLTLSEENTPLTLLKQSKLIIGTNISYGIKSLVANGMIKRTDVPGNRRAALIKLTAKGKQIQDKLREALKEF